MRAYPDSSGGEDGARYRIRRKGAHVHAVEHVVAMLYAQISHALSLNDVCDALKLRLTSLFGIRAAKPPAKNTLSHANKGRDCELARQLFWAMLAHLQSNFAGFVRGRGKRKFGWRFKRAIHAVDSTTIQLVANCMDWAKHRRRKAAAKCHLRLDLQSFLPKFALVDTAREHDNKRALFRNDYYRRAPRPVELFLVATRAQVELLRDDWLKQPRWYSG